MADHDASGSDIPRDRPEESGALERLSKYLYETMERLDPDLEGSCALDGP